MLAAQNDSGDILRDYLLRLDRETLVSHLITVVHKDAALYERLRNRARLDNGTADVSEAKKAITRATPLEDLFDPASVSALFRNLAALPRLPADATYEDKVPYLRLSRYLRARAEQVGDWGDVARLDELTATTAIDFQRLADLNLKAGKPGSAAEWLTRADAIDERGQSSRNALWSEVHAGLGDWNAAVSTPEEAFRRDVNFGEFQRLMHFAEQAGGTAAVRNSVVEFLQAAQRPGIWPDEIHAFTLVQILREEKDYEGMAANALARIERYWSVCEPLSVASIVSITCRMRLPKP